MNVDEARRILFDLDENGNIVGKSKLYTMYQEAAEKYSDARKNYHDAYADAKSDPMKLQNWPMAGVTHQMRIDKAWGEWKAADAAKVEAALAILEATGEKGL